MTSTACHARRERHHRVLGVALRPLVVVAADRGRLGRCRGGGGEGGTCGQVSARRRGEARRGGDMAGMAIHIGEEEEEPAANVTAPTSTSQTLILSETGHATEEASPPPQDLEKSTPVASPEPPRQRERGFNLARNKPLMKEFIRLGTQFIGYRDTVDSLKEALVKANKRADDLAIKLEQSEKAREKAEQGATSVGDLRKRLHQAETALSKKITHQIAREEDVIGRLESQNRRFVRKMGQDFELQDPERDHLLDALSLFEIHGDLARHSITDARTAFMHLFPYFFPTKSQPHLL
ncbi:hypothetical protein QYE76_050162 [Lolium multiflorum]|uniref:Uncharacterized protein n=1 Tax=Lolium multiflorum TaxID=4521 RepID=A0AAD8WIY7_LOLMU|nr:hypothetical protein QYE76_050162 [Lolium multiflorum]